MVDEPEEADAAVVSWIGSQQQPLRRLGPGGGDEDLQQLRRELDGVRIVGLGESTHGVHEFSTVKHRLVEFLVRELGFTVFGLEASYAACQPIDEYVRNGVGERATVLSGQHYLAWDTEEFGALVDWMREYNQTVESDRAVSFHGLDAGFNEVGRASVRDFLARLAPERLQVITPVFDALREQEKRWPLATDAAVLGDAVEPLRDLERFLEEEADRLSAASSAAELERNRWFVHVMNQWVEPGWPRERHLTENLVHVLESERPGAKAILWLHNSHVAVETPVATEPRLGWRLRDRYGDAYWCLALEFGRGSYQTRRIDDGALGDLVVTHMPPPPRASLPWYLEQAQVPAFVLPLRGAAGQAAGKWLREAQLEHGGMWLHTDPETLYEEVAVGEQYDAILFVDAVTPAEPTPNALAAARDHVDF